MYTHKFSFIHKTHFLLYNYKTYKTMNLKGELNLKEYISFNSLTVVKDSA